MIDRKRKIQKAGFLIFNFKFLLFNLLILPATATTPEPVISIVQSTENTNQWTGITNRLQTAGIKYCVIPLWNVRSAADWGDRTILFMPNVESLAPAQAIALEEWMSKGGRLIASGPVGSVSAPGVRQLLRTLLGGYWGFSLENAQQLQLPSKQKIQVWADKKELFGKIRGGVVVPDELATTQTAAVWDSKDSPVAVVATDRSTFFGWRWGVDAVASPELDTAWLQTSVNRFLKKPTTAPSRVKGGSGTCSPTVATLPSTSGIRDTRGQTTSSSTSSKTSPTPPLPTAPSPSSAPLSLLRQSPQWGEPPYGAGSPTPPINIAPTPKSDEAIDQLEQRVRFNVDPYSQSPISSSDAIALQHELENLIGRVESSRLSASVINGNTNAAQAAKAQQTEVASTTPGSLVSNPEQVIDNARAVAKNLPQLIAQKNYALARQQWQIARANLWKQFPLDQRLAPPEIRSVWLDRGTIVRAKNEQGLAVIFDKFAQAGINTVFFETVNAGYTIYPSKIAPQQNPLVRGWDPLESAVKLAHERGIELHAWVWAFAAGNRNHNKLLNLNPEYPGPVLAAHPDWAGYDNRGQMIPAGQGKPFFDPANPQLRQYLLNLYEEIVTHYNVDGLQLDYIRYPFQDPSANRTYGYGKAAREQFQQQTGVDPANISPKDRELWQKWTEFRTSQINTFVAQLSKQLREKRPNLILSAAVFPLQEQERIQKLQQQWEVWAKNGDIDLIVPMTYALETARFDRLAQPWIRSSQLGSALLVPGIRLLSLPTVGAFDQIQLLRDLPVIGYALFAAENFGNDLHKVFSATQGSVQPKPQELIPHRQPFQTAAIRYSALQREWKFLFQNNKLPMSSTTLATFHSQANIVQSALDRLAKEPNSSNLLAAKAVLTRFVSQFRILMRAPSQDNLYQIKVWENRLTTIDRLLRYGERAQVRK
ncbi:MULTISPECIES: family 10 glycosylhydrolase [Nostocales]|uniref:Glycosyl hydrolase-like 10 domain-containing protein n=4 Tax=Nostocales TaxID=1161 RepID=A0A0C1R5X3_9CYAN|nr:family 10 glycosylhydrolase [Tolypothrix bouteillei]